MGQIRCVFKTVLQKLTSCHSGLVRSGRMWQRRRPVRLLALVGGLLAAVAQLLASEQKQQYSARFVLQFQKSEYLQWSVRLPA